MPNSPRLPIAPWRAGWCAVFRCDPNREAPERCASEAGERLLPRCCCCCCTSTTKNCSVCIVSSLFLDVVCCWLSSRCCAVRRLSVCRSYQRGVSSGDLHHPVGISHHRRSCSGALPGPGTPGVMGLPDGSSYHRVIVVAGARRTISVPAPRARRSRCCRSGPGRCRHRSRGSGSRTSPCDFRPPAVLPSACSPFRRVCSAHPRSHRR